MRVIKVFPDYMSSGLWEGHKNLDESSFEGVLTFVDLMALRYWHHAWELFADTGEDWPKPRGKLSELYWQNWNKHGHALVDAWNIKQGAFMFVYEGDYWE